MNARRLLSLLVVTCLSAGAAAAGTVALVGATVHPVSSPPIENATVLIEDGTISAIGADVAVPAGAERVDLSGQHLYPGFIHPNSVLGLTEISSVRGTRDDSETGDMNSDLRAEVAFHADSELLPVAMSGGVLTAHVVPQGGIFRGTSAVMTLDGWNWEDMTLTSGVGMHMDFPQVHPPTRTFGPPPSAEDVKKKKDEALETINQAFDDAEAYAKAQAAAASGGRRVDHDSKLEGLVPVLEGSRALFVHAEERNQIVAALDWIEERELTNVVLVSGEDSAYLAGRIAESQIPVILDGVLEMNPRDWERHDGIYTAARRLDEAGVRFAIGDGGGSFSAPHVRNLPFHASMAAAHGLSKETALRSITLSSAEILGVDDRLGSLEVGKIATLMATTGDPLEIRSRIERVWIAGEEIDLQSMDRQKKLYEKYDNRPRREEPEAPEVTGIKEKG